MLLEFSLSMVVLWLIVAATLDLGRAFAAAQLLQSAVRSAARELALAEFPADRSLLGGEGETGALSTLFDEDYLVVDADCLEQVAEEEGRTPEAQLARILGERGLLLNQMLRPLMIFERVTIGGREEHLLRYPGALLRASGAGSGPCKTGYTVAVPRVDESASRIDWHRVVEPLEGAGAFEAPEATVALQVHYPFQAAGLSGWRLLEPASEGGPRNDIHEPVAAAQPGDYTGGALPEGTSLLPELDAGLDAGAPVAYAANPRGRTIPVYGGSLGLGFQAVLGETVRPYRRVITVQAVEGRQLIAAPPPPSPPEAP